MYGQPALKKECKIYFAQKRSAPQERLPLWGFAAMHWRLALRFELIEIHATQTRNLQEVL